MSGQIIIFPRPHVVIEDERRLVATFMRAWPSLAPLADHEIAAHFRRVGIDAEAVAKLRGILQRHMPAQSNGAA